MDCAARHRPAPAPARGHRQRQDRGLPPRRGRDARAGALGHRPRARDRADAADRRPLRRALRRHRRDPALRPDRRRALRRVAAPAARARPSSASGPARPCSPRCRTSGSSSSTRSTIPPTSRTVNRATTPGGWPSCARVRRTPCCWRAAPRLGPRAGRRLPGCRCRSASTRRRCPAWSCWRWPESRTRCTRPRGRRWRGSGQRAARRSSS